MAVIAGICLASALWRALVRASIPFQMEYEEGNILNAGLRLLDGLTPYPDPASFPYTLNPYGPVGYGLTSIAVSVFGVSFFGPRLIVVASGVLCAALIAALVRRLGGAWGPSVFVGVYFITAPLALVWLPWLRVDYPAIFFSLLGLFTFLVWPRARLVPLLFFALAILTKITAIAAPSAYILELILRRERRWAVCSFACIVGLFVASALWPWDSFGFHQFRTHPEPYNVLSAVALTSFGVISSLVPLALILYARAIGCRCTRSARVAWLYLATSSASALTAGNPGADTNHLLEWSAAVCVVAGLSLSQVILHRDRLAGAFSFAATVVLVFLSWEAAQSPSIRGGATGCADAYAYIASFPGTRVLSEYSGALVLGGKSVLVSNPYVTTQLGKSLQWSEGTIEELAGQEYFDLIVLGREIDEYGPEPGRWSLGLIDSVREKYYLVRQFECKHGLGAAYAPKSSTGRGASWAPNDLEP